jgi:acetate kinase
MSRPGPVLVLNAGSSSLKFVVVDVGSGERALTGLAERLGTPDASMELSRRGHSGQFPELARGTHHEAVSAVLEAARAMPPELRPVGVGHRVVHGGDVVTESVVVTDSVEAAIRRLSALAPLHNPPALEGIAAVRKTWPELAQVAVFDTAFHHSLPPRAYRYAVPLEWYSDLDVRRYGFHGTSVRYVSGRAAEMLRRPSSELALVVAHLGNGCSATAVLDGRSVDTTMGLTPLEGLVMGSRSGDVDPGLFGYLARQASMDSTQVLDALNTRSGLMALSRMGNDMREIQAAAERGGSDAALAVDVFVYRAAKAVAALVVGMGRLDGLVFTGGIGEHSAPIRARIVDALGFLGLCLDGDANRDHGLGTGGRINAGDGPAALVVATDEELMIAQDTAALVGGS